MDSFRVASRFFDSHYRLLVARMSPEEAKAILGFPPRSNPTPEEIKKVYRQKALENHPDRGGDVEKMKLVNVAKDVLEGTAGQAWRPEPPPPPPPAMTPQEAREFFGFAPDSSPTSQQIYEAYQNKVAESGRDPEVIAKGVKAREVLLKEYHSRPKPNIPGNPWEKAKGDLPVGVSWKIVSEAAYNSAREYPGLNLWLLYGEKDGKGYVAGVMNQLPAGAFQDPVKGLVTMEESWACRVEVMPAGADVTKKLPAYLKSLLSGWVSTNNVPATFTLPKKWFGWPDGTPVTDKTLYGVTRGRGISLKDALIGAGIGGAAAGDRKVQVQLRTNYNEEKLKKLREERRGQRKPVYTHEGIDVTVIVNGKEYKLEDDSIVNLTKLFFPTVIPYRDISDGRTWNLTALRGSRFKADAGAAIRILADALTSEPSALLLALYAAAESYEPETKQAALRALVAATSLETASVLTGEPLFSLFYSL